MSKALERTLLIIIFTVITFFICGALGGSYVFGFLGATLLMGGFILYGIEKLREELSIKMNANNILLKDEQDLNKNKK